MRRRARHAAVIVSTSLLVACARLLPLAQPPVTTTDDPTGGATTREEAIARLGPPAEVRFSEAGDVLIYRRLRGLDRNPNRYWGDDRGDQLEHYQRVLLYLDRDGRVVGWSTQPE